MNFAFEAISADGRTIKDIVEGDDIGSVAETLRGRGLMVMRLTPTRETARREFRRSGADDFVLFAQQMKMMLESGASLVPALLAVEQQARRASFRNVISQVRKHVEEGGSLAEGFRARPDIFKPVFCAMVAAGEATAKLPEAFARLSELAQRQQAVRRAVVGAMAYPAVLSVMMIGVVIVLFSFVIPRFRLLFKNLNAELPMMTQIMFDISLALGRYWPIAVGAIAGLVTAGVFALRNQEVRDRLDRAMTNAPLLGRVVRRLMLGRVLRVWAAMLQSHVPLLEAIEQSKATVRNRRFVKLIEDIHESVSTGGRIGNTLAESKLVEPIIVSAISTGEENGRLAESVAFVSRWLDEDNRELIGSVTRLAEPVLLSGMGLVVGLAAMTLFIPLFDMATAA
ncbi:MAG: type II secretion system F family protein [Phycisphaerales bacterium]|nr:type II secretion system F family protein [Phycisphaerales bacterium]